MKPCLRCGEPSPGTHCIDCRPPDTRPANPGYDWAWQQLSVRARKLQDFCTDCGSRADLTADHSAEAWARKAAGKVIRLRDVEVVCRSCNSRRGRPRGVAPSSKGTLTAALGQVSVTDPASEALNALEGSYTPRTALLKPQGPTSGPQEGDTR